MFTAENVLTAEFTSENIIKVTHKNNDDVLVTVIQKNPRKESYKSLIESGWTLKRIAERTKELQPIDTGARLVESIANGYSWANDQLKAKLAECEEARGQLQDLYTEISNVYTEQANVVNNLQDLYHELNKAHQQKDDVVNELQDVYNEQQQARGTLHSLYSESKEAHQQKDDVVNELQDVYNEQQQARGTLESLYSESKEAHQQKDDVVNELQDVYNERTHAEQRIQEVNSEVTERIQEVNSEVTERIQEGRSQVESRMRSMKERLQQNYEKYQHLYGMDIISILFDQNDNKEILFKTKLEILNRPLIKEQPKEFKSKIRKAKTVKNLVSIISEVI